VRLTGSLARKTICAEIHGRHIIGTRNCTAKLTAAAISYVKAILKMAVGLAFVASIAPAQAPRQPDRPRLPDGADRNDPWTYYRIGQSSLARDPDKAADAFYWAARLNPVWAEAYYARRVALLLHDRRRLAQYFRGDRRVTQSAEAMGIDSLYLYALTLNPFLGPQLDHLILEAVIRELSAQAANRSGTSASEIAFAIERSMSDGPPEWRAMMAYRNGRYDDALSLYAKAIAQSKEKAGLLSERGRLFYQVGKHDSALVSLTQALVEMRKADKKDFVFLYQSKALMEERIGLIERIKGDKAAARDAFGRALQEDLSYFPAHVQLAFLALESGDVATVVNEMDLAVQIKPNDPGIRYQYGYALGDLNKLNESEVQLKKAIELDPDFAAPHFVLAEVYQAQRRKQDALKEIEAYIALSAANDTRREEAVQMAALLGGSQ
jgi:tetratricopeptide (TPR) repeat protein